MKFICKWSLYTEPKKKRNFLTQNVFMQTQGWQKLYFVIYVHTFQTLLCRKYLGESVQLIAPVVFLIFSRAIH